VLKVVQQDSTSFSGIHFAIDGNLVAGKTLMVTVAAKFPGTYTPVPSLAWKRPRLNVNGTSRSGAQLWSLMTIFPEPMRPDWQLLTATAVMPQDLASLEIYLETQVAAEVYFDNFGIALIDPKAP
jgi:hypothetical protein